MIWQGLVVGGRPVDPPELPLLVACRSSLNLGKRNMPLPPWAFSCSEYLYRLPSRYITSHCVTSRPVSRFQVLVVWLLQVTSSRYIPVHVHHDVHFPAVPCVRLVSPAERRAFCVVMLVSDRLDVERQVSSVAASSGSMFTAFPNFLAPTNMTRVRQVRYNKNHDAPASPLSLSLLSRYSSSGTPAAHSCSLNDMI